MAIALHNIDGTDRDRVHAKWTDSSIVTKAEPRMDRVVSIARRH